MAFGFRTKHSIVLVADTRSAPVPGCESCLRTRLREAGIGLHGGLVRVPDETLSFDSAPLDREDRPFARIAYRLSAEGTTPHLLLPVPGCERCGHLQHGVRYRKVDEPLAALTDPLLGIFHSFSVPSLPQQADGGLMCFTSSCRVTVPSGNTPAAAAAAGTSEDEVLRRVVGEGVERYLLFRRGAATLRTERWCDIRHVAPERTLFHGYSRSQYALSSYMPVSARAVVEWVEGRRLRDGVQRFVPAQSVYLSRPPRTEVRFGPMLSTGAAAHRTLRQARSNAVLETIERYCLARAWHMQDFGIRISIPRMDDEARRLIADLAQLGIEVVMCSLGKRHSIPVIVAFLFGAAHPYYGVGSAARPEEGQAAASALREAALVWTAAELNGPRRAANSLHLIASADMHPRYYQSNDRASRLRKDLDAAMRTATDHAPRRAAVLNPEEELAGLCPEAVVVDITTPDMRYCGYFGVKVVAPGLPSLHFGSLGTPARSARVFGPLRTHAPHPFG